MDCLVFMVAIDKDGTEVYPVVEFDTGGENYPENNTDDIQRVVNICNAGAEDYTFIDMFGIRKEGEEVEQWEEIEDGV